MEPVRLPSYLASLANGGLSGRQAVVRERCIWRRRGYEVSGREVATPHAVCLLWGFVRGVWIAMRCMGGWMGRESRARWAGVGVEEEESGYTYVCVYMSDRCRGRTCSALYTVHVPQSF